MSNKTIDVHKCQHATLQNWFTTSDFNNLGHKLFVLTKVHWIQVFMQIVNYRSWLKGGSTSKGHDSSLRLLSNVEI